MSGDERNIKEILGLISLALVPFGVFMYLYSTQILSDLAYLPQGMVQDMFAQSQTKLRLVRILGGAATLAGIAFLVIYVVDYIQNPERYYDNYKKSVAIFGAVAGLVWIIGFLWWGYLPATSAVVEFSTIAEQGAGSGDSTATDILTRSASDYEIAVFDRAAAGGAVVLGVVWWVISVVSLKASPSSSPSVRTNISGDIHCAECGSKLPSDDIKHCPYCGEELHI